MNTRFDPAAERHHRHFEHLYAKDGDPWRLRTSWGERHKRYMVSRALGPRCLSFGLELGCGAGITTRTLAPHFRCLLAIEGSNAAVKLARKELQDLANVRVIEARLPVALPGRRFDAVIASEILYYLPGRSLDELLASLYRALKPGGRLITANHVHRFADWDHTLAQLSLKTRARFGRPVQSVAWGSWRIELFCKSLGRPLRSQPANGSRTTLAML